MTLKPFLFTRGNQNNLLGLSDNPSTVRWIQFWNIFVCYLADEIGLRFDFFEMLLMFGPWTVFTEKATRSRVKISISWNYTLLLLLLLLLCKVLIEKNCFSTFSYGMRWCSSEYTEVRVAFAHSTTHDNVVVFHYVVFLERYIKNVPV